MKCSAVVREGEELSKAMRIHDYNRSRKLLPAREGWCVVDNDYMKKHAPELRWFCGSGWWDLAGAFVFASREEAQAYASSHRGKTPDVEYWKCPAQYVPCPKCGKPGTFIRERPFADGSGRVFMCSTPKCPSDGLYFYPQNSSSTEKIP